MNGEIEESLKAQGFTVTKTDGIKSYSTKGDIQFAVSHGTYNLSVEASGGYLIIK